MRLFATILLFAVAGCEQTASRLATCADAANPKLIVERCYGGNLHQGKYVGDTACFPFGPAQRMVGFWHVALEASHFTLSRDDKSIDVWLDVPTPPATAAASMHGDIPRTFAVTLVGRRSLCPAGFGHMGLSPNEIIVEELISIAQAR